MAWFKLSHILFWVVSFQMCQVEYWVNLTNLFYYYMILFSVLSFWWASGCVVECRICNQEVAGSNGYLAPSSTQPSIPPGSVNEYQLLLGRQRQVWLIPITDERVGVQVKLWYTLRTRAKIPERFCGGDSLRRCAISSVCVFLGGQSRPYPKGRRGHSVPQI